jgi:glutamyl-tRNA synthetase
MTLDISYNDYLKTIFMPETRTRFAPSPTGYLHIGGLRTALFAYLVAKSESGQVLLRIEDTDRKRYVEGSVEKLQEVLSWAGIVFDEGPLKGGDYGPYVQSERQDIYEKYLAELLDSGQAYHCFCTPERLEEMRKTQQAAKQAPRYDRICRSLSRKEAEERIKAGEKYVIRQKMPLEGEVKVFDELRGEIIFPANELEDQVLIKSDGTPTYQFAAVVDDHLMRISHVVRGEEWIPSLPKNILLYQAFGWQAPLFIHLPLTLNKEGGKLSKRHGDVSVESYREKGYLPEALLNFCALLGWHPKGDEEIFQLDEIVKIFDYSQIGTSSAVFDTAKLDYFNGYYIRQKPVRELARLCLPYLEQDGLISQNKDGIYISAATGKVLSGEYIDSVVALEQERLKVLSDISEHTSYFFVDVPEYDTSLLAWKKMNSNDAQKNLAVLTGWIEPLESNDWTKEALENTIVTKLKDKGLKIGEYLWPMRVALTGRKASPGPFEVAAVLGRDNSLRRLKAACGSSFKY